MGFRDYEAFDHLLDKKCAGKFIVGMIDAEAANTQYMDFQNYYDNKGVWIEQNHIRRYVKDCFKYDGKVELETLMRNYTESLASSNKEVHMEGMIKSLIHNKEYYDDLRKKYTSEEYDEEKEILKNYKKNQKIISSEDVKIGNYRGIDLCDEATIPGIIANMRFVPKGSEEEKRIIQEMKNRQKVDEVEDDDDYIFGSVD